MVWCEGDGVLWCKGDLVWCGVRVTGCGVV